MRAGFGQTRLALPRAAVRWLAALMVLSGLAGATWLARRPSAASSAVLSGAGSLPAQALYGDAPVNPALSERLIQDLQARLQQHPGDAHSYTLLGAAYLQLARETGDPAHYGKAEAALLEALRLQPDAAEAVTALGALALARHQFEAGLAYGEQAYALNPYSPRALGVIADAQIELGRYAEALETVQRMVDTRPDMSAYARVAYLRELHGDVPGAIEAMTAAARAGSAVPEHLAWTLSELGLLRLGQGDTAAAQHDFEAALRALPGYLPAQAGLARAHAAHGNLEAAIALYEQVVAARPISEYVIALGDCYAAAGRAADAETQYALVDALADLQQASGVEADQAIILFAADHPGRLEPLADTVARARAAYERRPTIYAADTLAWALYQAGAYDEASTYAAEALRLNTQDALLWFHAGLIAARRGEAAEARQRLHQALSIDPHFSLRWRETAEQTLQTLPASAEGL